MVFMHIFVITGTSCCGRRYSEIERMLRMLDGIRDEMHVPVMPLVYKAKFDMDNSPNLSRDLDLGAGKLQAWGRVQAKRKQELRSAVPSLGAIPDANQRSRPTAIHIKLLFARLRCAGREFEGDAWEQ